MAVGVIVLLKLFSFDDGILISLSCLWLFKTFAELNKLFDELLELICSYLRFFLFDFFLLLLLACAFFLGSLFLLLALVY